MTRGRAGAVHRQADRARQDLRRPGGDRHRERAAVRGGAGAHGRAERGAAAADGDRRRAEGHQPLDLRPAAVLDTLVESAAELCEADMGVIFQRDGDALPLVGELRHSARVRGLRQSQSASCRVADSVTGRVALEARAVHVADVLADPEYTFDAARRSSAAIATILCVPLLREGDADRRVRADARREVRAVHATSRSSWSRPSPTRRSSPSRTCGCSRRCRRGPRELSRSLEDLRTAQDRLVQTEKLASLGQLTAGIAHEIKNPLNFVNNFSALSAELIDELQRGAQPARRSTTRCARRSTS